MEKQNSNLAVERSQLSDTDFHFIRNMVASRAAIIIDENKKYLVESRIANLIEELELGSYRKLVSELRKRDWSPLHDRVVECMTTNETFFFRDITPFDAFKEIVIKEKSDSKKLNIWSAACSTGQEPYTLAMLLHEEISNIEDWNIKITASDINRSIVKRAEEGVFSNLEINRGLPPYYATKYFREEKNGWHIRDRVKDLIEYKVVNLVAPWPDLGQLDIVFMRNVLIYFNLDIKIQILNQVKRYLKPGGYLFLGSGETTININDAYEVVNFDKYSCHRLKAN